MNKPYALFSLVFLITSCTAASTDCRSAPAAKTSHFAVAETGWETVNRVVDGDTFVIDAEWNPFPDLEWKIRILGIDTPEKGALAKCDKEKVLSKQAQALAERLIAESHHRVRLQGVKFDKYGGRFDAAVYLENGHSLGDELLQSGLARRYTGAGPKPNWCR